MLFIPLKLLALPLALLLVVGGFLLYKDWQKKKNYQASYLEWKIEKHLREGDEESAKRLIEEGLKKGGAFKPLIASHLLELNPQREVEIIQQILSDLRDKQMIALYTERLAFAYLKEGNKEKSLQILNSIDKESFSYPSAQILKAQVLLDIGKKEEARKVLEEVIKENKGTYWSNLAQALLKGIEG